MQSTAQLQANIKRREKDVMKLMMSGKYEVSLVNEESTQEFDVLFEGPADSNYEGVSLIASSTNACIMVLLLINSPSSNSKVDFDDSDH